MTTAHAYKILGLSQDSDKQEIKKKYRQLMHQVHPDTSSLSESAYPYSAQEIIEAYSVLCKKQTASKTASSRSSKSADPSNTSSASKAPAWDAPLNPHAYMSRNIYHYAEDSDGNVLGSFIIATGKFLWKTEEDFSLFQKSIIECTQKLFQRAEKNTPHLSLNLTAEKRLHFQAELSYLLTQQFIDAAQTLKVLLPSVSADKDAADIFKISAMLEFNARNAYTKSNRITVRDILPGTSLYPAMIKNHRLFLKTPAGEIVGYLSFKDDRLYYIVIPLFEQKRAQVKIRMPRQSDAVNTKKTSHFHQKNYQELDFWLKVPHSHIGTPENINLQIENLLHQLSSSYI